MEKVTKTKKIEKHLLSGKSINPKTSWEKYGVYRLSAVIHSLRKKGYIIVTEMVKYGGGEYGVYKLIKDVKKQNKK